jgi:hypothetical protein
LKYIRYIPHGLQIRTIGFQAGALSGSPLRRNPVHRTCWPLAKSAPPEPF